jgi:hypothetical protein
MTPFMAVEFATVRVISGAKPGPALEDMVKHITSPLLLIAAGPPEMPFGESMTALPETGRSTSGTSPTSATPPLSAKPPKRMSDA